MEDGRYLILDGANRFHCLEALKFPHILVQTVDYDDPEQIELLTWNHAVGRLSAAQLLGSIRASEGLSLSDVDSEAEIAQMQVGADHYIIAAQSDALTHRIVGSRRLVSLYKDTGTIDRLTTDDYQAAVDLYPHMTAMIIFPRYTPDDLRMTTHAGELLPPGISRHIVKGRALRLNYPMGILRDLAQPIEEKNAALQKWVRERAAQKSIRFYAESTYIFDE